MFTEWPVWNSSQSFMVKGISFIKKVNLVVSFQKVQETLHHAVGVLRVSVIPVSQGETLGNRTSQDTEQNSREMPQKKNQY